jgi:hypothetical protein
MSLKESKILAKPIKFYKNNSTRQGTRKVKAVLVLMNGMSEMMTTTLFMVNRDLDTLEDVQGNA